MTVKVSVKFFTTLREIVGKKEEQIEFSKPINVNAVLKQLSKKYGKDFDDYMFDELGDVRGHLQVLVNGQSVTTMNDLRTQLNNGDQVAILPPVGGG
ncbi:MAG TPA: ubiquitin-like small modifier protein 1 [Candidatus Bathyarchaeia archaeon]|nr:ubiquitin-like small modifier protein 1 [Candidatus Bathyarchaeia archaeon]